jgi:protein-S-isoprenylcysteine O-methyltransferase Ste14
MIRMLLQALFGLVAVVGIKGLVLFLSAGSFDYWPGWLYLAVFTGCALAITIYLWVRDPELLRRRVRGGPWAEKETSQRIIMWLVLPTYTAIFVVSGLDWRFHWSEVPVAVVIAAQVLQVVGFAIELRVLRECHFTAATVEVVREQRVITTGPYAIVRHPFYSGAMLMMIATPPALGSWWGLLAVVALIAVCFWRMFDEERILSAQLTGYREYCATVRSRLIPGIF